MSDIRCGKCYKPYNIFDLKKPNVNPVFNYIKGTTPEQSVKNFEQCAQKISCKDKEKIKNDCCKYLPYDTDCNKVAEKFCSGEKIQENFTQSETNYIQFFLLVGGLILIVFLALSIKSNKNEYERRFSDITKIY